MKEKASDHVIDSAHEDADQAPPPGAAANGEVPSGKGKRYKTDKNEYLPFLVKALKEMHKAGKELPVIKSAQGAKGSFQFKGHIQCWDALQGYWERNRRVYVHLAKVHYRALYLGAQLMLAEEEMKCGAENGVLSEKLQIWLEQRKQKHSLLMVVQTLKTEIRQLIEEKQNDLISEEEFQDNCQTMIKTFETKEDQIKFSIIVDKMVEEETVRAGNVRRQTKHRQMEREAKGIHEVK
jgi:hypothetical protein